MAGKRGAVFWDRLFAAVDRGEGVTQVARAWGVSQSQLYYQLQKRRSASRTLLPVRATVRAPARLDIAVGPARLSIEIGTDARYVAELIRLLGASDA